MCRCFIVNRILPLFILILVGLQIQAQVSIDTTLLKERLAEVFLGEGVRIFNVKVHGNSSSMGAFTARNSNFPLEEGIVLSTGRASAIARQNLSGKTTTSMREGMGSDPDLSRMVTRQVFNCTVLEFDFIPMFDSLYFDYVFGSEEYPEYVGSPYNDVFCLLLYGPNLKKPLNLARVGNPSTTVMINHVNHKRNKEFFQPNWKFDSTELVPYTIEYDGFTTALTASCPVVRGKMHHLKIAIGNVNDFSYDSGVFLRAGSFGSRGGQTPQLLPFDFDARNPDQGYENMLDSLANLMKNNPKWRMAVLGHTDSLGSREYNLKLSQDRAQAIAHELIKRGVHASRIFVKGYADTKPLRSNGDEEGRRKNRRVEIVIRES